MKLACDRGCPEEAYKEAGRILAPSPRGDHYWCSAPQALCDSPKVYVMDDSFLSGLSCSGLPRWLVQLVSRLVPRQEVLVLRGSVWVEHRLHPHESCSDASILFWNLTATSAPAQSCSNQCSMQISIQTSMVEHVHVCPCLACEHRRCEHDRTTISWAALAWRTASGMLTLSAPHTRYSITVRAFGLTSACRGWLAWLWDLMACFPSAVLCFWLVRL